MGCQSNQRVLKPKPNIIEGSFYLPCRVNKASVTLNSQGNVQTYSIPLIPNESIKYVYSATAPISFQIINSKSKESYIIESEKMSNSGTFKAPQSSNKNDYYDFMIWTDEPAGAQIKVEAYK